MEEVKLMMLFIDKVKEIKAVLEEDENITLETYIIALANFFKDNEQLMQQLCQIERYQSYPIEILCDYEDQHEYLSDKQDNALTYLDMIESWNKNNEK